YIELLHEASIRNNSRLDIAPQLSRMMERIGFVDVRCDKKEIPIRLPKNDILDLKKAEISKYALPMMQMSIEAYGLALFTRMLEMSELEARVIMKKAEDDMLESPGCLFYNV